MKKKPNSIKCLNPDTWYNIRCKHTFGGRFLLPDCEGSPVLELHSDWAIKECVFPIPDSPPLRSSKAAEKAQSHYPWSYDERSYPVLDTKEKLIAYAKAWLHTPVDLTKLHFEPHSLETVRLIYGTSHEEAVCKAIDLMIEASSRKEWDSSPPQKAIKLTDFPGKHAELGIVNGIAAEVINNLFKQDNLEEHDND